MGGLLVARNPKAEEHESPTKRPVLEEQSILICITVAIKGVLYE